MNVLLIYPPKPGIAIGAEEFAIYEPLALEYLAAGIKNDHDVKILDMRIDRELEKILEIFKPDVVGITSYTIHVNQVKKISREIKEWNPDVLTVVGGHHPTVSPGDFKTPYIDLIVVGEGVAAFQEIIRAFEKEKKNNNLPTLTGNYAKIYEAPFNQDIDSLPFPARELTGKYRQYYSSEWLHPLISIRTSKGCPFKCKFCASWKIAKRKYMKRKIENIIREIAEIEEKYISFADDESMCDVKRMEKLAEAVKKEGIKKNYYIYSRSDTIVRNPKLFEKWRDIGMARLGIGLEFPNDRDLKYMEKKVTVKENEEAVRILHNLDVEIAAFFILNPELSREDFKLYAEYCIKLDLDLILFFSLTPLPGSDFYQEVKDKLITHNYDLFDLTHVTLPTKLPLEKFYEEYLKLYKSALTKKNLISYYTKLPIKKIPSYIKKNYKFMNKLKNAHRDYN